MDELEMLSWAFTIVSLVMPISLACQKKWFNALAACGVCAVLLVLFYVTVMKTAVTVESECRRPLIGLSINK